MSAGLDDAEQQFGPYLVYERLGVGGMATVHRALERGIEGFERMVALKRLLPHLAEDASFIKAFVREAKLASLLNHVNIVQIYELGRVGTEYFISMEYIDGRDIRRVLRHARKVTGPPPMHVSVGILLQLCEALDYAHTRTDEDGRPLGLVHRDVSPSNVIVSTTGLVKMIDFGIAKAQTQQHRTQTGRVKGKLAYMAPEAITGARGELDARSDLFAVGVIAHELLTARPLFASKNEYETLLKVQRGDIMPPSTFNSTCPPELDDIVARALARDPDERYPSAAALRDDLQMLRRRLSLQTSYRDIANWVDWAFAADTDDPDAVIELINVKTPAPRSEDEDAVEIAWGNGEGERAGPIVLEEVPDVSEKHLAPHLAPAADKTLYDDDDDDDIPTPVPSHGSPSSRSGREPATLTDPEPNEIDDAPLDFDAPNRGQRISGQRISQNRISRPGSQVSTDPMGQPLVDALEAANLAAETLLGMHASDTQPSMRAAPASPDDPADEVVPPPGRKQTAPMGGPPARPTPHPFEPRTTASVVTSAPRTTASVVTSAPRHHEPTRQLQVRAKSPTPPKPAPNSEPDDDPPTRQINIRPTPPPRAAGDEPHTDEPQTDEVPLRAVPPPDPRAPVVRFKGPTSSMAAMPDPHAVTPDPEEAPLTLPLTPTHQVPRNQLAASTREARPRSPVIAPRAASESASRSQSPIGAALIERSQRKGKRSWMLVAGVVVLGALGTAAALVLTRSGAKTHKDVTPVPSKIDDPPVAFGTVKFVTEPSDTEISIEGRVVHNGAPWATELEPGTYQIQITRQGYKSWLTSLELSPRETHSLRVVLEKLPVATDAKATPATLILSSTPSGLEAELDGKILPVRTPIRMPLSVGPHVIALRKDGAVVWHQELNASAAVDYEFNPSMEEAKRRERAQRKQPTRTTFTPAPPIPPMPRTLPASLPDAAVAPVMPPPDAATPVQSAPAPPTPPPTPTVVQPPSPPPATTTPSPAPTPTRTTAPLTVPPSAVTKISGATPELAKTKSDLPATVAAKVCISHTGRVTSVELITKLDPRSSSELVATLETWKYGPYMHQHVATPVCFAVSLRLR
ncbi:MAG: protein kinase [Kofleriaceae bacterium]|nr:protein kinase [Kofleriaceae bacterium]